VEANRLRKPPRRAAGQCAPEPPGSARTTRRERLQNNDADGKSFFYDELVVVVPRAGRAESSRFA
jgi:hypothetical protein